MSPYRKAPAALTVAPPAPWWRILRAWAGGTFGRLKWRRWMRAKELHRRAYVAAKMPRPTRTVRYLDS